jgi:hypothetical protein
MWMGVGAVLSAFGVMHGWAWTPADAALDLGWWAAGDAAIGYAVAAVVLLVVPLVGTRDASPGRAGGSATGAPALGDGLLDDDLIG